VEKTHRVAESLSHLGNVKVALGDLGTDEGADSTAKMATEAFGGVDVLINNAGGPSYSTVGLFNITPADWVETHKMNVVSAVNLIQRLVPAMQERKWGRVIMMASIAAQTTLGASPAYSATKSATLNLTLSLAKTLKYSGVTVNAVSPGMIMTEKIEEYLEGIRAREGFEKSPEGRQRTITWLLDNMLPQTVERLGVAEDIGYMCAFLCGPQADFISVTNIRIDGGASPSLS
jgi:NAD(P)-dependent dehydrogenase (short-subunit alcohol dehydrogenase family)